MMTMKPRTTFASGAVVALLLALAIPASANHLLPGPATTTLGVPPQQVDGNPTCSDLVADGAFLFEFKLEPVQDSDNVALSFDGLTGQLDVDVYNTPVGQLFDFDVSGDFLAAAVFAKAGPGGNLYDYTPGGADAQLNVFGDPGRGDTGLHGPVNPSNGKFYGLSHLSFCFIEAPNPDVMLSKAGNGPINEGEDAEFTITVTNNGPGTAEDVEVTDDLPAGFAWTVDSVSQGSCSINAAGDLECDLGDLAEGTVVTIVVSAPTNSQDCGMITNAASVSASNEDAGSLGNNTDSDSITILCGALQISKTAKHADASGATGPDLVATFEVVDNEGTTHTLTTNAAGFACADGLALGQTQSITETAVPAGYAAPSIANVAVAVGVCDNGTLHSGGTVVPVENTPLTDVTITVDSQVQGATVTVVNCWEGTDTSGPPDHTVTVSDGSLPMPNLLPTDPAVTLTCQITVDP